MSKRDPRSASQRQLRVAEEIRHALADVLERGELRDPGLSGVSVTITEVRVSADLRHATAFVMPLGGGDVEAVVAALGRARPFLRRRVAGAMQLKYVPDLHFIADETFETVGRLEALLSDPRVARDLEPGADDGEDGHGP